MKYLLAALLVLGFTTVSMADRKYKEPTHHAKHHQKVHHVKHHK